MISIKGYEDKYSIDESGSVFSHITNKTLKHNVNKNGYHAVRLYRNGKQKSHLVSRLVAITYLGNSDLTVNHIDGNKSNNHVSNLEWISQSSNVQHAYDKGLKVGIGARGETHGDSKLTVNQVLEIRERKRTENISNVKLSKDYPVGEKQIGAIIRREKWGWL